MGKSRQSANLVSDNNIFVDIVNDRVGIGTTTPQYDLDVVGSLGVSGVVTASAYYGDGRYLQNIVSGVGISTVGGLVGTGATVLNFRGAGISTVTVSAGIATINITGGGGVSELKTVVSTTSPTGVGSFSTTLYRSADVIAQIAQGSNYQVGRYLMIHDGSTVSIVEESSIATGSMLGSFNGVVNGSNVELRVTLVSAGTAATVTTKIDTVSIP